MTYSVALLTVALMLMSPASTEASEESAAAVRAIQHAGEHALELRAQLRPTARDQRVESDGAVRREDVPENPGRAASQSAAAPRFGVGQEEELVDVAGEHVATRLFPQGSDRTEPARDE